MTGREPPPKPKTSVTMPSLAMPPTRPLTAQSFSGVPPADSEALFQHLKGVEERLGHKIDAARAETRAELADQDERITKVEIAVGAVGNLTGMVQLMNQNLERVIQRDAAQDVEIRALKAGREAGEKAGAQTGDAAGHIAGTQAGTVAGKRAGAFVGAVLALVVSAAVTAFLNWAAEHVPGVPKPPEKATSAHQE